MKNSKYTIIVGGFLGLINAGGAVWDYIQYPLGLHLMGHDVYYFEDTRMFPIYESSWNDSKKTVSRLKSIMESFGLGDRWVYRDEVTASIYGKTMQEFENICSTADIFLNVSCANVMREEYEQIPVRILLDTDPMFTQIQINTGQSFTSENSLLKDLSERHTHHFTYGENIHKKNSLIPPSSFKWHTTRQPICLKFWKSSKLSEATPAFTTLMNWKAGKSLFYDNQNWGQKDVMFPFIINLPDKVKSQKFKIVVAQSGAEKDIKALAKLQKAGWDIIPSETASGDHLQYQDFITQSKAEISVAKETYVKAKTGWFSGRSACYLASGRPVITQDTGWSDFLPSGKGLFTFTNEGEAAEAVRQVSTDWEKHSTTARKIAENYFDHTVILNKMLNSI